jgi:hypothetical protein
VAPHRDALALITGDKQRLANNAALQRSIRHRFPYIDPLHHLQVELVRRYRAGNRRTHPPRHPHLDQRHRGGVAQHRLKKMGRSMLAVQEVPADQVRRYGIVAGEPAGRNLIRLEKIVEKPAPEEAPSRMGVAGRYI